MRKLNILVTNDDGIDSPGIKVLSEIASEFGKVTVVAPDRQRSAESSNLTVDKPLRVKEYYHNNEFLGYAIDGTPADCVKLAINNISQEKFDFVFSGINHGKNTSVNVLYSGTVAGAIEGHLAEIPSIAFSMTSHDYNQDFSGARLYIKQIIDKIIKNNDDNKLILNINIPSIKSSDIKGLKVAELSNSKWIDTFEKRVDPFKREYYWFSGSYVIDEKNQNSDDYLVENGYIVITPLKFNFTNSKKLDKLHFFEK